MRFLTTTVTAFASTFAVVLAAMFIPALLGLRQLQRGVAAGIASGCALAVCAKARRQYQAVLALC